MKKILGLFMVGLLSCNTSYALQLTSNSNGPLTVSDPQLKVGGIAPQVTLTTTDFERMNIGGPTGRVQIISTVESFNNSVSDIQTIKLNAAAKHLQDVDVNVITYNLPFVINAFKTKYRINNVNLLSTFNNNSFGTAYGLQVIGGQLTGVLARSIFVVDKTGAIIYKEIPFNIDQMPNIKAAIAAAEKASKAAA